MTKNEIQVLRANLLGGMDTYIREVVGDEEIFEAWLYNGVPDGSTEEDLMEIAEDEFEFKRLCIMFARMLKHARED